MADGSPDGSTESDEGLNDRVLALSARAESVLNAHPRTRGLVASLPHGDDSPLRIALVGPYSAGKSMLIAALLRLASTAVAELVDAAPKTHKATPYEWNGVTLIDLPGTLSGNDEATRVARLGVRSADALMIVTTSELPGEAESKAIQHALDADGFADRSVVVVNKMNAENSDPDIILEEVRKRLGPFADRVAIVPTDARDKVDAINDPDLTASQRELLSSESGIDALEDVLQRIIAPGVACVRPKAQALELSRVLADAEQQWELDDEEFSAAETTTKVEETISLAKERVLSTLERESVVVASAIKAAGSTIADSVSEKDGNAPADVIRDADGKRDGAMANFDAKFSSSMRAAFDALAAGYGTDVPEPEAWVNPLDLPVTTIDGSLDDESRLERVAKEAATEAAKEGSKGMRAWLAKVAISGREQGSAASEIATRINKSPWGQKVLGFGDKVSDGVGKFKPHGRGKAADKVAHLAGKAQWAAVVIGPALDLGGVVQDQVKRVKIDKHRKWIRSQFNEAAHRTRSDLADAGTQHLSEWIFAVEQSLSGLTNQGAEILAERETALREFKSLRDEVEKLVRIALGS